MVSDPPVLPRDLLARILVGASRLDSIAVGGQALNIWGDYYYTAAPRDLEPFQHFVSKDIDFFGTARAASDLAEHLQATSLVMPERADALTPNTAVISIEVDRQVYAIDFLHQVAAPMEPDR